MRIVIECDEQLLRVIQESLDLYTRLLMGQWEEVEHVLWREGVIAKGERSRELVEGLKNLRDKVLPELDGYAHYGISNENTPISSKLAYELYGVLRHELYKLNINGERHFGVDAYPPLKCSGYDLPRVMIEKV